MVKHKNWHRVLILVAVLSSACAGSTPTPVTAPTATPTPTPTAASTATPAPTATPVPTARDHIKSIQNYIVYYGTGRADDLARYDLAIVQPDTLVETEVADLKSRGTLVVAYLSVGEAEPDRPWFTDGRVDLKWLLGQNENWGSYYVDANQAGWQQLMVALTGEFIAKGYDGVFLDTVDTVTVYPQTKPGMIKLIQALRQTYPGVLLVQNRGFTVVDKVASDIDAVMFEDLSTTYNFEKKEYLFADNTATAQEMVELHKRTGLPILALDYAPPDNPGMAFLAVQTAHQYGFIPAVSVINLDDIPDYGLDRGGPADIRVHTITAESDGEKVTLVAVIENAGLTDAAQVPVSLKVGDEKLASDVRDLPIGARFEWRVPWPDPTENADITAIVAFEDGQPENNTLTWTFTSTALAVEPLLPPDQQQRRPAANGPDLTATALTTPLTIDGDLSDWGDLPCTDVSQPGQISYGDPGQWSGPDDLSGRVCYAWDAANLYVGFSVKDDVIVQRFSGSSLWQGDHVELWFDTQLQLDFETAENNDDDFQLGLSPGDFASVKPDFFIWTPSMPVEEYANLVQYALVRTPAGYAAEIRIPASLLKGLRLAPDHAIGATFEPSDTDTPGGAEQELIMSTAPQSSSNWGVPTLWNNLIFKGQPTTTTQ